MKFEDVKVGDTVKFRAACMWDWGLHTRKVKMVDHENDRLEVRFGGWGNFGVQRYEVREVNGKVLD